MLDKYLIRNQRGLTIIELLVVLGIFTIILSGGLFLSTDSFRSYYFDAEEKMLVSLIRGARSKAISNINYVSHGVFVSEQSFVLFQGESYEENSGTNEDFPRNKSIQIENTFTNDTIVFENLTGKPRQTGEIRIFDGQRESVVKIELEGRTNE